MSKLQAIRGMHDILPADTALWNHLERLMADFFYSFGYQEIRPPVVEKTALFSRAIGEVTDIVEKEMYTFKDQNGDLLTLRPEGTAGVVRAAIENGLLHNQTQRLWYQGQMFRRERPQKDRYRQFYQIGVEAFGFEGPDIDLELLIMTSLLWQRLGITNVELHVNSLGTQEERTEYRAALIAFLEQHHDFLDTESKKRLQTNPLRVLDSKNPQVQQVVCQAPKLLAYLGEESKAHFKSICDGLDAAGISYVVNPNLVRGLDYYMRTVFEWITTSLGAQGTICGGGRYDGLIERLGGKPTTAVGFALGVERLISLLAHHQSEGLTTDASQADIFIINTEQTAIQAQIVALQLRNLLPERKIITHCGGGSFKSQFRKADKSGAQYALIMGEDEAAAGILAIKPLRGQGEQLEMKIDKVADYMQEVLS